MSDYSIKSLRKKFAEKGVFYTDEAMALKLKSYMPEDLTEIYDPTCGSGNLLAVFGDSVGKYGQELDEKQAEEARNRLVNAHIIYGDTLVAPAFIDKRFKGIVANYPFSIKWQPNASDARFSQAPCTAPPSKADWAFLLHILFMLADDGVAATLNFPGILYRGNREQKIRQWFVDNGYIHEVVRIEKDHFVDTSIETALMIIKKSPTKVIKFADNETGDEVFVPVEKVRSRNYNLSVSSYVEPRVEPKEPIDLWKLEKQSRDYAIRRIKYEIEYSLDVAEIEGWSVIEFINDIISVANEYKTKAKHQQQLTLF